jgi:clan AA aspartic protease (TIGR02281 family)
MKKFSNGFALIVGLFMCPVWADGVVHKCKDPQGEMIYQASPCARTDVTVSSWTSQTQVIEQTEGGEPQNNRALVLKQQGNGHYFVDGVINGKPLNFVVDTGASVVSIPRATAYAASMSCKDQVLMQTANGASSVCTSVIARLKVGPFLLKDVSAMIVPNLSQPLLGMNVLQRFRIEQDNGEMRLSAKN